MADSVSQSVSIHATPARVWALLTDPALMVQWMGGTEMRLEVLTAWETGHPICIRGFHHIRFENKGIVLHYEAEKRLSYSHFSSVSRLPDKPENYSVLDFRLGAAENNTLLTLHLIHFPTETIQKHLAFYWRTTLVNIKKMAELPAV